MRQGERSARGVTAPRSVVRSIADCSTCRLALRRSAPESPSSHPSPIVDVDFVRSNARAGGVDANGSVEGIEP